MAREFDNDTANFLQNASAAPVVDLPISISAWAYTDTVSGTHCIASIGDSGAVSYVMLQSNGTSLRAVHAHSGVTNFAFINSALSTGTWFHACGVFASTTSRSIYHDGTKGTDDTDSTGDPTPDQWTIGQLDTSGVNLDPWDGRIAEVGVWNVALTQGDVDQLNAGCCPLMVRPDALVAYAPLFAGSGAASEYEWVSGGTLTENGTVTAAAHPPRIIYPHPPAQHLRVVDENAEADWVGGAFVKEFGTVAKAEHPPQTYPHARTTPIQSHALVEPDWARDSSAGLKQIGSVTKGEHPPRVVYPPPEPTPISPAAASGITVDAPLGTQAYTGLVPTVSTGAQVDVPAGTQAYTGQLPTVSTGAQVDAPVGTQAYTGQIPTISTGEQVDVPLGSHAYTGLLPEIQTGHRVDSPLGIQAYTGQLPTISTGAAVEAPLGTHTYTGLLPTVQAGADYELVSFRFRNDDGGLGAPA